MAQVGDNSIPQAISVEDKKNERVVAASFTKALWGGFPNTREVKLLAWNSAAAQHGAIPDHAPRFVVCHAATGANMGRLHHHHSISAPVTAPSARLVVYRVKNAKSQLCIESLANCPMLKPYPMGTRKRKLARRRSSGTVLVLVTCAVLAMALFWQKTSKNHLKVSSAPSPSPRMTNAGALQSVGSPGTNQPGVGPGEDGVVTLVAEGNEYLARGNYAMAVQRFAEALAVSPEEEDLHYNLAIALAKLGRTQEAKQHYLHALQIYPDYADARNNLGNLLMTENKVEEAIEQFKEAIKITPENPAFHNNLGTAFARQRKLPESIVEFGEAVKQRPSYVEARVNLANALLASSRVEECIAQLDEALRLKPDFQPAVQTLQRARQKQASGSAEK